MTMNMNGLKSLTGLLLGIAMASLVSAAEKPNIVFIMADDLGYGDLGCYGQKFVQTPHLDRMAAEGMRFTQHYSGSTVCAPSRCALFTGKHTGHATVRDNEGGFGAMPLGPADVTVAQVLKQAGYDTAIVGSGIWRDRMPPASPIIMALITLLDICTRPAPTITTPSTCGAMAIKSFWQVIKTGRGLSILTICSRRRL